jgi:hypothetical protein
MTRLTLLFICECLLFFIPLNIYVIGDHEANGVQWALFRFQESSLGNSLILVNKDIHYVTGGILKGSSAYATIIWVLGACLLVAAFIILGFAVARHDPTLTKSAGLLTIACGALFLIAMLVQYGLFFANDHGSSVPVGVPLILFIGIWLFAGEFEDRYREPIG